MNTKRSAHEFLSGLEVQLNESLPHADVLTNVSRHWDKPKSEKSPQELLACKENVFLYHLVLPEIWKRLARVDGMDAAKATAALRCEYFAKFPAFASSNAFRRQGHPFSKKLGMGAGEIFESWKKPVGSYPLNQAYPDLAITAPSPFEIVFDAKYFEQSSFGAAVDALVGGVYEVVHYRGLPAGTTRSGAPWRHEYGCLLAYDATPDMCLRQAWETVECKDMFWDDANIFVMILRGH
jgi:hypothetical protein